MTDIWDEKPKSEQWVKFKYPVKSDEEVNLPVYDAQEMDAWLEKLQDEVLTAWAKDENRLTKVIIERGRKLHLLRYLVEDYLPQIGMTIHFREMFYQIVGEPYPEWFEVPEPGFYELEWMETVQSFDTSAREEE